MTWSIADRAADMENDTSKPGELVSEAAKMQEAAMQRMRRNGAALQSKKAKR